MRGTMSLAFVEAALFLVLSYMLAIGTVFSQHNFPYMVVITFPVGGGIGAVTAVILRDPAAVPVSVMVIFDCLMAIMLVWFILQAASQFLMALTKSGINHQLLVPLNLAAACLATILIVRLSTVAVEATRPLSASVQNLFTVAVALLYLLGIVNVLFIMTTMARRLMMKVHYNRRQEGLEDPWV